MDKVLFNNLLCAFNKKNITLEEIFNSFHVETFASFIELLHDFINYNYEELLEYDEFFDTFHIFLYTLTSLSKRKEDVLTIKIFVESIIVFFKEEIKDYNKNIISKDSKYYIISNVLNDLKSNLQDIDDLFDNYNEKEEYSIIWFIITKLKKVDYLYHILLLNPDYVNVRNRNRSSLFTELVDYYFANLDDFNNDDIKYYKRIFVLFLESDNLHLSNDELFYILETCEKNLINSKIYKRKNITFLINEIERHYEVINTDSRMISQDYCNKNCPIVIESRNNDKRRDFKDKYVISIDQYSGSDITKQLIDDAFSLEKINDNTYLLTVYVPDVDYFISKDSDTDIFMRGISQSVYAKEYKTPMLPYEVAQHASLVHGQNRPALAFMMKIDSDGKVLDIDFKKVIINVNYNLTKKNAEWFMKGTEFDKDLSVLSDMYELAVALRKRRKESIGRRTKSGIIIDEFNIIQDTATADYFYNSGIIFPYKNYLGKKSKRNIEHLSKVDKFIKENNISASGKIVLYSIFDSLNRIYYDTNPLPNKSFNNQITGNVGNPMREYISLETDRLIKDLIISKENNLAYWEERVERDCIECTEATSKIFELYKKKN